MDLTDGIYGYLQSTTGATAYIYQNNRRLDLKDSKTNSPKQNQTKNCTKQGRNFRSQTPNQSNINTIRQ